MNNSKKYNPCDEYIIYLKEYLKDRFRISKDIRILYDFNEFITNLNKSDIDVFNLNKDLGCYFSPKNFVVIKASNQFYNDNIKKCPMLEYTRIDDLYLDGIVKRMYAQIEFGFYHEKKISANEADLCGNIFKSLYTKSMTIKKDNINLAQEKYNNLQKEGYLNKMIIYGIIYAVYDYYNCKTIAHQLK